MLVVKSVCLLSARVYLAPCNALITNEVHKWNDAQKLGNFYLSLLGSLKQQSLIYELRLKLKNAKLF